MLHKRARMYFSVRFLSAAVLMSIVAACGSGTTAASQAPQTTATEATQAPETGVTETTSAPSVPSERGADEAWQEIVRAAEAEGRVVLYLAPPGVEEPLKAAFEEKYPNIELEYVRAGSGDILARVEQERATGADGADVVFFGDPAWYEKVNSEGGFAELVGPSVELWAGNDLMVDNSYASGVVVLYGIAYNTDLIPEGSIASYEDLLDLEGVEVALADVAAPGWVHWWNRVRNILGEDFLEGLRAVDSEPMFGPSTVPASQALAAGEVAISTPQVASVIYPLRAEGAPVEMVFPDDMVSGVTFDVAVLGSASRPNAAQVLADFILSEEGQSVMNHSSGSPLEGIGDPGHAGFDPEDLLSSDQNIAELREEVTEWWEPLWFGS